jgi:hypothetical protein
LVVSTLCCLYKHLYPASACLLLPPWLPPCHYKEWYNFLSLSLSLNLYLSLVRCTTQEDLELKFYFSLSLQFLHISGSLPCIQRLLFLLLL